MIRILCYKHDMHIRIHVRTHHMTSLDNPCRKPYLTLHHSSLHHPPVVLLQLTPQNQGCCLNAPVSRLIQKALQQHNYYSYFIVEILNSDINCN